MYMILQFSWKWISIQCNCKALSCLSNCLCQHLGAQVL